MSFLSAERIAHLKQVYHDGLLCDEVPFWTEHGYDSEYGGVMTCLDRQGRVIDADKGVWQQGRFAWMLAFLYNHVEQNPQWLEMAGHTLQFVRKYGYDTDGRMFFHLTREGRPIRKRRYAYAESFMAIAAGEYARATGDMSWADIARQTYSIYGNHIDNPAKFTDVRPMRGLGHPMINIVTCQRLRESINLSDANERIDQAISDIAKYHVKDDLKMVMETVSLTGEIIDHFDQRTNNPGHAIEGAWFIMQEGRLRNRPDYIDLGLRMLDYSWERGWDKEYGGILYYYDAYNHPVSEYWQDMKFWWPQNEAIIATLMAYVITGEKRYADMHTLVHDWAYRHFPDKEYGSWFGYLARDGRVCSEIKGNLYKGFFHTPRQHYMALSLMNELSST